VPVPSPEPDASAEKKPAADIVRVPLIIGASRNDVFTGIPFQLYDVALQACAQRLEESGGALVEPSAKGFSRSEAVDRAKAEKEGYVIWLHLRGDDLSGSYANNLDQVYIEYVVFEHTTGKMKTQGNCYPGAYRKGNVVLGSPTGRSNAVIESRMRAAAEDAADRILKALHLATSSTVHP
jgi:hypothetical protein